MAVISGHDDADLLLIAALLDAFEASGRVKAGLPPGRRDDVARLLEAVMADPERLDAYCAALVAERRRRGPEVEMRLLGMDCLEIPEKQIADHGFDRLADDQLADIALSPEGIEGILEY